MSKYILKLKKNSILIFFFCGARGVHGHPNAPLRSAYVSYCLDNLFYLKFGLFFCARNTSLIRLDTDRIEQ